MKLVQFYGRSRDHLVASLDNKFDRNAGCSSAQKPRSEGYRLGGITNAEVLEVDLGIRETPGSDRQAAFHLSCGSRRSFFTYITFLNFVPGIKCLFRKQ